MSIGRKVALTAAVLTGVSMLAVAAFWLLRKDIARSYVDDALKQRGVTARYEITEIGPARQRLDKLVLGDPSNPDLTADRVIVETRTGFAGVSVKTIRASGVRLRGRYVDGALDLGVVNKLLPKPDGKPFTLPDMDVDLQDARMALDSKWGRVGLRLDGKGNIANGFTGQVAAVSRTPKVADCGAGQADAFLAISTSDRRITVNGPVRFVDLACPGVRSKRTEIALDAITDEGFARADGDVRLTLRGLRVPQAQLATASSDFRLEWDGQTVRAKGGFDGRSVIPDRRLLDKAAANLQIASATPVAPIAEDIAIAIRRLASGGDVTGQFSLAGTAERGSVILAPVLAASQSGARLRLDPGGEIRLGWPDGQIRLAGGFALQGGGFPASNVKLTQGSGRYAGTAIIAPLSSKGARLALAPLRFGFGDGPLVLDTTATLDGPLGGGWVRGLVLPVSVRGGQLAGQCLPVAFQSYRIATLDLQQNRFTLCRQGQGATIAAPRLVGRLGQNALTLSASAARIGTNDKSFALDKVAVQLGAGQSPTVLDLSTFNGRIAEGGASGHFTGASGRIGSVPLLLSEGGGNWRFARSALSLSGVMRVADTEKQARFQPLIGRDFTLRLADGRITAKTILHEPISNVAVAQVDSVHTLGQGNGHADFSVDGLQFGEKLQPEAITSTTLGVIANVEGRVDGNGRIEWDSNGVTRSTGVFRTEAINFAAAFGPVTGLKGQIALSDLLGLETAPGQSVEIGSINPGIAVTGGVVRYRLLPGLKAEVLGGRWPFAGGQLILEPTVLDLNTAATRRLTFRVEGLDAALFVQQMAFENIAVTGKFDGTLPMVFDQNGGRIENGNLIVRPGGGTLSYIGEVTNADLGRFAKLAFDALKSIRYRNLRLELNGALDGEMVTLVRFDGVNQLPITQNKNFFLKQFDQIPFIFNITIKAPFRGLFATVRSLNDPSVFLPTVLPPQLQPVEPDKSIQPKESDPVR
jgi:translocation and assembly module TamB